MDFKCWCAIFGVEFNTEKNIHELDVVIASYVHQDLISLHSNPAPMCECIK